jgi:hypothetical protein
MIAIVESPYQLQNALSLFNKLGLEGDDCQILIRDNGNKIQKKQFLEQNISVKLTFFYLPANGLLKIPLLIWFYLKFIFLFFLTKKITLGDARSIVCKPLLTFLRKDFYLVDDGLYLISHINKLSKVNCNIYTSLPLKAKKTDKFTIINKETPQFSVYDNLKGVSFIGQHLVELGFVSEEDYFQQLNTIKKFYADDYSYFTYYAHRYESDEKLEKIKEIGFNVIHLPMSIEQYFYENRAPRGVFISFYSTALLNIYLAHVSKEFYYIEGLISPPTERINASINLCHEAMKTAGIRVLEI